MGCVPCTRETTAACLANLDDSIFKKFTECFTRGQRFSCIVRCRRPDGKSRMGLFTAKHFNICISGVLCIRRFLVFVTVLIGNSTRPILVTYPLLPSPLLSLSFPFPFPFLSYPSLPPSLILSFVFIFAFLYTKYIIWLLYPIPLAVSSFLPSFLGISPFQRFSANYCRFDFLGYMCLSF